MNREDAVKWLNHRLRMFEVHERHTHFNIEDVTFIMSFIHYRTGKSVSVEQVKYSIEKYPVSCMSWIGKLINYLINNYDIEIKTTNNFLFKDLVEPDSQKILKYK